MDPQSVDPQTTYLVIRTRAGLVAKPISELSGLLEQSLGLAWADVACNMPGSDPVGDLGRWYAEEISPGVGEYIGVERQGERLAGWASPEEEREHLRRACPDTFAKLVNVEQAPIEHKYEPWDIFAPREIIPLGVWEEDRYGRRHYRSKRPDEL